MLDQDKSKQELVEELAEMRRRVAVLEGIDAERQGTEAALRENEKFQAAVLNSLVTHIAVLDRAGRIAAVNESWLCFARKNGVADESKIGVGVNYLEVSRAASVAGDPCAVAALDGIEAVLQGRQKTFVIEYPCHSADQQHWFLMHITANTAEVGGAIVTHTEITGLKQAEEALRKAHDELEQRVKERTAELAKANESLRQSNDELRAIYDGMPDGLLITDIETLQFVRANVSLCQMLGYSDTELRSLSVSDIHPAEALPYILEKMRTVEEADLLASGTVPVIRKDGTVFYAEIVGKFLMYHGRPCAMGIFRDITERKTGRGGIGEGAPQPQAPSAVQRSRTATHRLRNP